MPVALVLGNSFDLVVNNFSKTLLMFFVIAGAVRGPRDVDRLMFTYLMAATLYATVVVTQFDIGSSWRLGHLLYYDANDFATFAVTAIPLGVYFLSTPRLWITQVLSAGSLAILTTAFVRSGSRGGFVALIVAGVYMLFRFTAIPLARRITATAIVVIVIGGAASSQYWEQMGTIVSDDDYNRSNESGRVQIWERGMGYMLRFPVLGVGPGVAAEDEPRRRLRVDERRRTRDRRRVGKWAHGQQERRRHAHRRQGRGRSHAGQQ